MMQSLIQQCISIVMDVLKEMLISLKRLKEICMVEPK